MNMDLLKELPDVLTAKNKEFDSLLEDELSEGLDKTQIQTMLRTHFRLIHRKIVATIDECASAFDTSDNAKFEDQKVELKRLKQEINDLKQQVSASDKKAAAAMKEQTKIQRERDSSNSTLAQQAIKINNLENELQQTKTSRDENGLPTHAPSVDVSKFIVMQENVANLQRAVDAEIALLNLKCDIELKSLERCQSDAEANHGLVNTIITQCGPTQSAQWRVVWTAYAKRWGDIALEIKGARSWVNEQFNAQKNAVMSGTRLSQLPPVVCPDVPPDPAMPDAPQTFSLPKPVPVATTHAQMKTGLASLTSSQSSLASSNFASAGSTVIPVSVPGAPGLRACAPPPGLVAMPPPQGFNNHMMPPPQGYNNNMPPPQSYNNNNMLPPQFPPPPPRNAFTSVPDSVKNELGMSQIWDSGLPEPIVLPPHAVGQKPNLPKNTVSTTKNQQLPFVTPFTVKQAPSAKPIPSGNSSLFQSSGSRESLDGFSGYVRPFEMQESTLANNSSPSLSQPVMDLLSRATQSKIQQPQSKPAKPTTARQTATTQPRVTTPSSAAPASQGILQQVVDCMLRLTKNTGVRLNEKSCREQLQKYVDSCKLQGKEPFGKGKAQIDEMALIVLKERLGFEPSTAPTADAVDECAICLMHLYGTPDPRTGLELEVTTGDHCTHRFHKKCLDQALQVKNECPLCRSHQLPRDDFPTLQ